MGKINVYDFCTMFNECKGIEIHGWYLDGETEKCIHKKYDDRFDHDIYVTFEGFKVWQFKATKKGHLDIICGNF